MKQVPIEKRRTVALVGHNGSGKSHLLSSMLGLVGKVDKPGPKVVDYDPIEQEKASSVTSHLATFEWKDGKVTVIDTPGFGDFMSEVINALFVSENIVMVVNATAGVEIQTERYWQIAKEMEKPIMVFVNQMDKERADFQKVLEDLKERFERKIIPVLIPIGKEDSFKGVVDVFSGKAYVYDGGKAVETEVPADVADFVEEIKNNSIEDIVELDEELMEKYLEEGEVEPEKIFQALRKGYASAEVVPVLVGSAEKIVGIDTLLDRLFEIGISPAEAKPYKAVLNSGDEVEIKLDNEEPFVGVIFKAEVSKFVGKITYLKVLAGKLKVGDSFINMRKENTEKVGHIHVPLLNDRVEVEEAEAGDIAILLKLSESAVGDTLVHKDRKLKVVLPKYPEPMYSRSVNPKSKQDIDKISNGLARLADSDPTFKWEYDPETQETVISGLGATHLEVMVERLKSIFGVEVDLGKPKIAYRETIRKKADAEHKHKKQTGGHGQYGHVKIRLEPLPRGTGYEFVDQIVGGVIPKNFIPSVDKGIREAMKKGVLAGYPVVDVRVVLYDGSYHEVDSSDISFQIAAIQAFKKGMEAANPVILEPIMEVEVFVPDENAGDVTGEISGRRGRPLGMEPAGKGLTKIKAEVPLAEMLDFSSKLSSITSGRGYFTMRFLKYQEVPPNIQEKIIEERKRELEQQ
ncbi:MAG: elongation factor G [Thermotogaceae bacterium]|nr:elongation factor G [Thermotogaceae bacterium]